MIHKRVSLFCLVHFGFLILNVSRQRLKRLFVHACSSFQRENKKQKKQHTHTHKQTNHNSTDIHANRLKFVVLFHSLSLSFSLAQSRFFIYLYYKIKLTTKISKSLSLFGTILKCVQSLTQPNNNTADDNNNTKNQPEKNNINKIYTMHYIYMHVKSVYHATKKKSPHHHITNVLYMFVCVCVCKTALSLRGMLVLPWKSG